MVTCNAFPFHFIRGKFPTYLEVFPAPNWKPRGKCSGEEKKTKNMKKGYYKNWKYKKYKTRKIQKKTKLACRKSRKNIKLLTIQ